MQKVIVMSEKEYKKYKIYTNIGKFNVFIAYCTLFFTIILLILVALVIQDSPSWSGKYAVGLDWIIVKGYDYPSYMLKVAKHEIGHHVYFVNMNDTKRDEWKNLVDKSTSKDDYVTEYAKTNKEEDFAETFMFILENQKTCTILNVKNTEKSPLLVQKKQFVCDAIEKVDPTLLWN